MAVINFPTSPTVGDIYTFNGRSWQWNGSGWQTVGTPFALTVGTTPISGGTSGRLFFDNAGIFGEISGVTSNGTNQLTIGTASSLQGAVVLANTSANSVTLQSSNTTSAAWTMTLPTSAGTNGYVLTTDGSGVTSWAAGGGGGSGTVNSGTAGQMTYYASTGTAVSGNANATITNGALTLGQTASVVGQLLLSGNTSGKVTITPAAAAGTWTLTLPTTAGTNGYVLTTDGTGVTSWAVAGSGSGTVNSGTAGQLTYYASTGTTVSGDANATVSGGALTLGVQSTTAGSLVLANTNAGAFPTTIQSSSTASAAWSLTLPTTAGTNGYVLSTNGSGVTSWVANGAAATYVRTSFTATGGQTTFTVSYTVGYIEVYLNGVLLNGSDYTASNGTSVVLAVAAAAGDILETVAFNTVVSGTSGPITINSTAINSGTSTRLLYDNGGTVGEIAGATSNGTTVSFAGSSSAFASVFTNIAETVNIVGSAPTSTTNYYVNNGSVQYYTSNATTNWTLNIAFSSGTTLNSAMSVGQVVTVTMLTTQGGTAYYNSAVTIDGTSVSPYWQGGTAPSAGNASGIDAYTYAIVKTGASTYTVLASLTQF